MSFLRVFFKMWAMIPVKKRIIIKEFMIENQWISSSSK